MVGIGGQPLEAVQAQLPQAPDVLVGGLHLPAHVGQEGAPHPSHTRQVASPLI